MKNPTSLINFSAVLLLAALVSATISFAGPSALAQQEVISTPCDTRPCFGGDLEGGTDAPFDIPRDLSLTELIMRVISFILDVILVIAVLAIIIAGVYLITGMGSDSSKEKAKSIVLYVILGLLLILFARAIVLVFLNLFG